MRARGAKVTDISIIIVAADAYGVTKLSGKGAAKILERRRRRQVDVALDGVAGMAFVAVTGHERPHVASEPGVEIVGRETAHPCRHEHDARHACHHDDAKATHRHMILLPRNPRRRCPGPAPEPRR
jgi:hypothetical protein